MKTAFVFLGIRINIASRARRRWLVALIYALFAALDIAWFSLHGNSFVGLLLFAAFATLASFLGGRSYGRGLLPPDEIGDERERTRRYRAHYLAYNWLDLACFPALGAFFFLHGPDIKHMSPAVHVLLERLPLALLGGVGILYYTLPQAILLCSEPDLEPDMKEAL
jgi:hypothetical protein